MITEIVSVVLGAMAGGGMSWLFTLRSDRRKSNAEASDAEVRKSTNCREALDSCMEQYATLTEQVAKMQQDILSLKYEIAYLNANVCFDRVCDNRVSERPYKNIKDISVAELLKDKPFKMNDPVVVESDDSADTGAQKPPHRQDKPRKPRGPRKPREPRPEN